MSGFIKTPTQRELEILQHRLDKLEKRVDSLGSSVPPGSESALRGRCPECGHFHQQTGYCGAPIRLWKGYDPNMATWDECGCFSGSTSPTGGLPTPDLAAQPDSTTETPWTGWNPDSPTQRIGVYDYDSLVACLRSNYELAFPGEWAGDPQDMIQRMAAEIQNWRRDNA